MNMWRIGFITDRHAVDEAQDLWVQANRVLWVDLISCCADLR
jgi:hypothetical protein